MSSCLLVYMFVSFAAHLSSRLSVLSSAGLVCLSPHLPLFHFSLSALVPFFSPPSCPSFIRASPNRTGTAETACQKVDSVLIFLHNMRTDSPPATTVNALICIRVMCRATCWATATGMSTMESEKAKTNETRFHQSNG